MERVILMAKLLKNARFTSDGREYERDMIYFDEKSNSALAYSRNYSRWNYIANITVSNFTEEVKSPKLCKELAKLIKLMAKEAKLDAELTALRREMYVYEDAAKQVLPEVMPSCEQIKRMLEHQLTNNTFIHSWSCNPNGPHSLCISKDNDLGKGRTDLVIPGYDDQHELAGDENTLMKRYCPAQVSDKVLNKGLKLIKVSFARTEYSIGDKCSVSFMTVYNVEIPVLTGKNFANVCKEILTLATRL
jgi:hypothetical protein